jgi:cytochrome P450
MPRAPLPPGPKGHFLIGNLLPIARDTPAALLGWAREYGDVVRFRLGTMTNYMLNHPEDIEMVLRGNHGNFRKDWLTRNLSSSLGEGLITSEGETWRRQRRLAQPAFQLNQIEKYSTGMVSLAERLCQQWRPGETRDLYVDMLRLALDNIGRTLFGANAGGLAAEAGRILEVAMEFIASPIYMFPRLHWLPLPKVRRYRRACRRLDELMFKTIDQSRSSGLEGEDLLSRLLVMRDEDGSCMSDVQLRDELVTLFFAGHETTALVMSFTFYLLAHHPAAVARLEAEVEEVLHGRLPTAADVPRLRYTEWVIKESMRLYPPVPTIFREALSDCEIRGYFVPRGTSLWLAQWVVHRDPRWFDQPEEFRPERWDQDLARRLPRGAYFPFGDGPRICIGNQFAMMETVLLLATIAQRYRLELAPDFVLELMHSVTLRPKHGVRVMVRQREDNAGRRESCKIEGTTPRALVDSGTIPSPASRISPTE